MRAVNLLTYEPRIAAPRLPALPRPNPRMAGGIAAGVIVLGFGGLYFSASQTATSHEREVAALNAQARAVTARLRGANSTEALANRELRDAAVAAALAYRVPWDRMLRDVAQALPASVSVLTMSLQAPILPGAAAVSEEATAPTPAAATPSPTTVGFQMSGLTFTQPLVALVLDRLETVPGLSDVQLQSSTKTAILERPVRQFAIVASVKQEGASK